MIEAFKEKLNENKEVYIKIKVKPNSSRNEIIDIMKDEALRLNIKAKPENGKANEELIKFLSRLFKVGKKNVKIISGAGDRTKLVKITEN